MSLDGLIAAVEYHCERLPRRKSVPVCRRQSRKQKTIQVFRSSRSDRAEMPGSIPIPCATRANAASLQLCARPQQRPLQDRAKVEEADAEQRSEEHTSELQSQFH